MVTYAVGVRSSEECLGETLTRLGRGFATLDFEVLTTLACIDSQLIGVEQRVEQYLLERLYTLVKESRKRAKRDNRVVAVEIDLEIGAVVVQCLGYL